MNYQYAVNTVIEYCHICHMLNNFLPEFTFQYDSLCEKNMCTDLLSYFYVGSLFIFYP